MRFQVDNAIQRPRPEVQAALLNPAFYATLGEMPAIKAPELLDLTDDGEQIHLRFRYAFSGDLPSAARRVLDPAKMTWIHEETFYPAEHRSEFRMIPDHYRDRMSCSGRTTLEERGPETTNQRLDGDLVIHYPLVGRLVEKAIVMGLRQNMVEEAKLLERWRP